MGLRSELVEKIEDKTGTQDKTLRKPQLNYFAVLKMYEKITGEKRKIRETKSWHIKEIFKFLGIEYNKFYGSDTKIPVDKLEKLDQSL